jgi:hypothetical protein
MLPLSIMASTRTPSRGRMQVSRLKRVVKTGTRRGCRLSRRLRTSSRSMAEKSKLPLA